MLGPRKSRSKFAFLITLVIVAICSVFAVGQTPNAKCRPAVIPVENEPPPKLHIDPPLAEPLARGVAIIEYCAENLHIAPVFGVKALQVSPRVGHLHVRVDDASWVWAEASGNPVILMGLPPGQHKLTLELVNANHQALDKAEVTFTIPKTSAGEMPHSKPQGTEAGNEKTRKAVRGAPTGALMDAIRHHPE